MDPIYVPKPSPPAGASRNEIAGHPIEQMFGKELEISGQMTIAFRGLERICEANGLDLTEQVQFAFERQEIYLTKLAKQKKAREERACVPGFSERSWLRSAMRARREERAQQT